MVLYLCSEGGSEQGHTSRTLWGSTYAHHFHLSRKIALRHWYSSDLQASLTRCPLTLPADLRCVERVTLVAVCKLGTVWGKRRGYNIQASLKPLDSRYMKSSTPTSWFQIHEESCPLFPRGKKREYVDSYGHLLICEVCPSLAQSSMFPFAMRRSIYLDWVPIPTVVPCFIAMLREGSWSHPGDSVNPILGFKKRNQLE